MREREAHDRAEPIVPWRREPRPGDPWTAIDNAEIEDLVVNKFRFPRGLLRNSNLAEDWADAYARCLARVEEAGDDAEALDRALLWFLGLHQFLLRTKPGPTLKPAAAVALYKTRFAMFREGRYDELLDDWRDDVATVLRSRAAPRRERGPGAVVDRARSFIDEGQLARAVRTLDSSGVADCGDSRVVAQLRAKHPPRKEPVLFSLDADFAGAVDFELNLAGVYRKLDARSGTGPDGMPNVCLIVLDRDHQGHEAARVMERASAFASRESNGGLPSWWYWAMSAVKVTALVKKPPPKGGCPDVRPIGAGNTRRRATSRRVAATLKESAAEILQPTQFAVGVRDGVSAFAFSLRALIAERGGGGGGTGGGGGLAGQGPIFGTRPSISLLDTLRQPDQNGSVGERLAAPGERLVAPGVARRLAVAGVPPDPGGAAGGVANVAPPTRPADDSTAMATPTPAIAAAAGFHEPFVVIDGDERNAYNEVKRAVVVRELRKYKGMMAFARHMFLWLSPMSYLVLSTGRPVVADFRSEEGGQQGDASFPMAFAFATLASGRALDRDVKTADADAGALFFADDGVVVGPASAAIDAFGRFAGDIADDGRAVSFHKSTIWCPSRSAAELVALPSMRDRARWKIDTSGDGAWYIDDMRVVENGVTLCGVHVGKDAWVRDKVMGDIRNKVSKVNNITKKLAPYSTQSLAVVLRYCLATTADFTAANQYPSHFNVRRPRVAS